MRFLAAAVGAATLTAAPLAAQDPGWHGGVVVAKESGDQAVGFGIFGGVSLEFNVLGDGRDGIRAGVFYVQKGNDCCTTLHYVEVPVLYKVRLDEIIYAMVGPAVGYLFYPRDHTVGRRLDFGAVAVLGAEVHRWERLAAMFEVGINYGLLDTAWHEFGAGDPANRAVTVGVRLQK